MLYIYIKNQMLFHIGKRKELGYGKITLLRSYIGKWNKEPTEVHSYLTYIY